jgi:hypothetical protein
MSRALITEVIAGMNAGMIAGMIGGIIREMFIGSRGKRVR